MRMRAVLDRVVAWLPEWEEEMSYGDVRGVANVGAIQGGFGWRVSRTPHRTDLFGPVDLRVPPDVEMAEARRRALEFARGLEGVEAEVYVTAPGAELDDAASARRRARDSSRRGVRCAARARRDTLVLRRVRALALRDRDGQLRHVVRAADPEYGENLEIDGLVKIAEVYARAAQRICG